MIIFSFFSGVGMLDLGFQEAGFEIVFVNEYNSEFIKAYRYARRKHYSETPRYDYHVGDINEFINGKKITQLEKIISQLRDENEIIGFIGGPPCPDFSVGGKNKGREGENGKLAQSYIELILKYQPDFFLFENVKGLIQTKRHKDYFEELKSKLIRNGFCLSEALLNALSFGVPQDRDRIFLLGINDSSVLSEGIQSINGYFQFPWNDNLPYNSDYVKELNWPKTQRFIKYSKRTFKYDVPIDLTVEYWFQKNDVKHHLNRNDTFKVRNGWKRIQTVEEGDVSKKSFKRLHRWRYSPTAAYGNNEVHLHPYKCRRISVAEAMAIQSLPSWFELPPDMALSSKFKMIGNGVPFLMAYKLAEKMKDFFSVKELEGLE